MGQLGDDVEKWAADVIFGRARGFGATVARIVFRALSIVYGLAVRLRLKAYRQHWKEQVQLGAKVISVGNLTVEGNREDPGGGAAGAVPAQAGSPGGDPESRLQEP